MGELAEIRPKPAADAVAPAIVTSITAQIGPNRSITMQFGIPMDMRPADLNAYLDKVMAAMDRQNDKGLLTEYKVSLEKAQFNLETAAQQRANHEAACRDAFEKSGRHGEWKPTGSQKQELSNFDNNVRDLRDKTIPKLKTAIDELERKINEAS
jgi:hypothetical protein